MSQSQLFRPDLEMTVKDVIQHLSSLPSDLPVYFRRSCCIDECFVACQKEYVRAEFIEDMESHKEKVVVIFDEDVL